MITAKFSGVQNFRSFTVHVDGSSDCQSAFNSHLTLEGMDPKVIKLFSCSTQLSMKFKLLINIKKAKINEIIKFNHLSCSARLSMKKSFITSGHCDARIVTITVVKKYNA